jgi:hypothetical protein
MLLFHHFDLKKIILSNFIENQKLFGYHGYLRYDLLIELVDYLFIIPKFLYTGIHQLNMPYLSTNPAEFSILIVLNLIALKGLFGGMKVKSDKFYERYLFTVPIGNNASIKKYQFKTFPNHNLPHTSIHN